MESPRHPLTIIPLFHFLLAQPWRPLITWHLAMWLQHAPNITIPFFFSRDMFKAAYKTNSVLAAFYCCLYSRDPLATVCSKKSFCILPLVSWRNLCNSSPIQLFNTILWLILPTAPQLFLFLHLNFQNSTLTPSVSFWRGGVISNFSCMFNNNLIGTTLLKINVLFAHVCPSCILSCDV